MTLFSDLGTLESAGLIRVAKVEPDLEYHFLHSLVQDAAYASLLDGDRKRLHLEVGNALESLYPERKKELAALLGYHFQEAGQDMRALAYFLIAGDEALAAYANQEAEIQYKCALNLVCCSDAEFASLYSGFGEAVYRQGRFDEALQAIRTSIDIYNSVGDNDNVARLYGRVGRILWYAGDRPAGLQACLQGLELIKDAPASKGKASLMHEAARAYYFNGMSDKGLPLCRQALEMAEQLGAAYVQADALATLGILSGVSPEESLQALHKSVDLAEANGFLQVSMRAHQNLGAMMRTWLMDNDAALEHFSLSAEEGRLRGAASEEIIGLLSYTSSLILPGRFKEVDAELPRLDMLAERISNPVPMRLAIKFIRGALVGCRGDWDGAIYVYRELLQSWNELKNLEAQIGVINELTHWLMEKNRWGELDDLSETEALLLNAVKITDQDDSKENMWVYPSMSKLCARQGRLNEALEWLAKARRVAKTRSSPWDELFQGEAEMEIAVAGQDWNTALKIVEKLNTMEVRAGFRTIASRSFLIWADLHISRGEPADMERAQVLLREALTQYAEIGYGHYPLIAQNKLQMVRSRTYAQALDHEKLTKDLKKARLVQESLLPEAFPDLPGWELAVTLKPAGETSGDFYDYIGLPDGKIGLSIADVTDKGTSAALFMALSRSLWRTYAVDYPDNPETTMAETNQRILADTHGGLFITLFYGILDPKTGVFTYCSAGHHPAYWVRSKDGAIEELARTGIPLGVLDDTTWSQGRINLELGDKLVLYTDGVTDALNDREQFFSQERLQESVRRLYGKPVKEMHAALFAEVHDWIGQAQQYDDITLMVIGRVRGQE
jgi:serine phosphatase RsbU (regulator of sigma subunit)